MFWDMTSVSAFWLNIFQGEYMFQFLSFLCHNVVVGEGGGVNRFADRWIAIFCDALSKFADFENTADRG